MEHDRTGDMLRDTYHCFSCVVGGVFSLALFGVVLVALHEELLPSGRFSPQNNTEVLSIPLRQVEGPLRKVEESLRGAEKPL